MDCLTTQRRRGLLLTRVCKKKGVRLEKKSFDLNVYKNEQYDLLAQAIRASVAMPEIYKILERGI